MITIRNAEIKIFDEKGIEGDIAWVSFNRDEQDFDTLKKLGRSVMVEGMIILKEKIRYRGVTYFPR